MRKEIKLIRAIEKRCSNRNKKRFEKVFSEFKKKILIDNASDNAHIVFKFDWEWLKKQTAKALENMYIFTFEETFKGFKNTYNKPLNEKITKGIRDYFLKEWSKKNVLKQATNITETTKKILKNIIVNGQERGLSHKDMVDEIVNVVDGMTKQRASTIARTETSKTINATSYETASKIMKEKCWIHVGGKKTYRAHHKAISNKWHEIDYVYKLKDGVEALYPHEDTLPASEVVRCSCLIIFR